MLLELKRDVVATGHQWRKMELCECIEWRWENLSQTKALLNNTFQQQQENCAFLCITLDAEVKYRDTVEKSEFSFCFVMLEHFFLKHNNKHMYKC